MLVAIAVMVAVPVVMAVAVAISGGVVAAFFWVVGDPLVDGVAAAAATDHFVGGDDGITAAGVADDPAGGAAFRMGGGVGDEETDTGEDGEHFFHLGRTCSGSQSI